MAPRATDVRPVSATLYFLPVETRVPLKFGAETLTSVTCARVALDVETADGRTRRGVGRDPPQRAVGLAQRRALRGRATRP